FSYAMLVGMIAGTWSSMKRLFSSPHPIPSPLKEGRVFKLTASSLRGKLRRALKTKLFNDHQQEKKD
ncbi:MAG: hypothetical protein IJS21_06750, partial [Deltaproteobacteria bacterium]|nr:hypothetical protein [Deltaproteobacteria bacterium]